MEFIKTKGKIILTDEQRKALTEVNDILEFNFNRQVHHAIIEPQNTNPNEIYLVGFAFNKE